MGLLVDGQWRDKWYESDDGEFHREQAKLRNWVTADGAAGPTGDAGFAAAKDRYHLYVSLACPWAHRTLIFRRLKQLEDIIPVSVVATDMLGYGWSFDTEQGSTGDELYQSAYLYQLYTRHNAHYSGRVTVPVLWDKQRQCIVSNESADIIRMFNTAFDHITGNQLDFYPLDLQQQIDTVNQQVYTHVNNGVYRCGFATEQSAYARAYTSLFQQLDALEQRLSQQRYLCGARLTEADWRLFTTLVRFDAVYYAHFKCNQQRIEDYPALAGYLRELYQMPGIAQTVNLNHIKRHYYFSHPMINPTQIVPLGPRLDWLRPHQRGHLPHQAIDSPA